MEILAINIAMHAPLKAQVVISIASSHKMIRQDLTEVSQ